MKKNQASNFDLLKGRASFTNEPLWFRLVMCILIASFYIFLIYLLGKWCLPLWAKNLIQDVSGKIANLHKGRAP